MVGKRRPITEYVSIVAQKEGEANTFPKISNGRPANASRLLRSDVFNDEGRDKLGALAFRGGEPQSSSV